MTPQQLTLVYLQTYCENLMVLAAAIIILGNTNLWMQSVKYRLEYYLMLVQSAEDLLLSLYQKWDRHFNVLYVNIPAACLASSCL